MTPVALGALCDECGVLQRHATHDGPEDCIRALRERLSSAEGWWYLTGQYLRPQDGDAVTWDEYATAPVPLWVRLSAKEEAMKPEPIQ